MPVLVAAESIPLSNKEDGTHRQVKHIKMTAMDSLSSLDINYEITNQVDTEATVMTDGYKGYSKLEKIIKEHKVIVVKDKTKVDKVFPWVHKAISNAKRLFLGIHHSIKGVYMQNYLDEYCYKFNRRYFSEKIFDRLLIACLSSPWHSNIYKNG